MVAREQPQVQQRSGGSASLSSAGGPMRRIDVLLGILHDRRVVGSPTHRALLLKVVDRVVSHFGKIVKLAIARAAEETAEEAQEAQEEDAVRRGGAVRDGRDCDRDAFAALAETPKPLPGNRGTSRAGIVASSGPKQYRNPADSHEHDGGAAPSSRPEDAWEDFLQAEVRDEKPRC